MGWEGSGGKDGSGLDGGGGGGGGDGGGDGGDDGGAGGDGGGSGVPSVPAPGSMAPGDCEAGGGLGEVEMMGDTISGDEIEMMAQLRALQTHLETQANAARKPPRATAARRTPTSVSFGGPPRA